MRTTVVTGALLAFTVLTATPALAAPELTQRSCEAAGGSFSRVQGVKTCTTVTRTESWGSETVLPGPYQQVSVFEVRRYVGVSAEVLVVDTTTTRTQKGSGTITTRTSTENSSRYEGTCWEETYDFFTGAQLTSQIVGPTPCEELGLFL